MFQVSHLNHTSCPHEVVPPLTNTNIQAKEIQRRTPMRHSSSCSPSACSHMLHTDLYVRSKMMMHCM
jgi:hypothetical protein